jgi:hypothetical protein
LTDDKVRLIKAWAEREEVVGFFNNLERYNRAKEIAPELYKPKREEYLQKLSELSFEISQIKESLKKQLDETQRTLSALEMDLGRLDIGRKVGEIPLAEYQSSERGLRARIAAVAQDKSEFTQLLEADSLADCPVLQRAQPQATPLPPTKPPALKDSNGKAVPVMPSPPAGAKMVAAVTSALPSLKKPTAAPAAGQENRINPMWWLAPALLAVVGGLVAWLLNKQKDATRALHMLFVGIGMSVLQVMLAFVLLFAVYLPSVNWGQSVQPLSQQDMQKAQSILAQSAPPVDTSFQRATQALTQLQSSGLPIHAVYIEAASGGKKVLEVVVDYKQLPSSPSLALSPGAFITLGIQSLIKVAGVKTLDLTGIAYITVALRDDEDRIIFTSCAMATDADAFRKGQLTQAKFVGRTSFKVENRLAAWNAMIRKSK